MMFWSIPSTDPSARLSLKTSGPMVLLALLALPALATVPGVATHSGHSIASVAITFSAIAAVHGAVFLAWRSERPLWTQWSEALAPLLTLLFLGASIATAHVKYPLPWLFLYFYVPALAHFYRRTMVLPLALVVMAATVAGLESVLHISGTPATTAIAHMILPTLLYVLLSADPEREREVRAAITAHEEALERLRAEEKRLALAREVHDGIGAHLTAAAVQAEVATDTQTDEPLRAQAALARLRKRIAQAIEELSLLTTQRPQTTWGALIDELRVVTEGIAQPVAWTFDASCVHPESVVSPEAHLALRRALQEGVANAVRHGKPRRISIRIRVAEEQAEIRVEDDGVGLSGSTAGFGRRSIAARMESVGGLAEWQPGSVGGTALHLSLPIRATSSQVAA